MKNPTIIIQRTRTGGIYGIALRPSWFTGETEIHRCHSPSGNRDMVIAAICGWIEEPKHK